MDYSPVKLLSDVLSTLTIMSCLFLKVPQILSIRKRKSADGIYLQAMLMEITGFTIVTLYNFTNKYSLLTYMEYPIILVQIFVMLFFVLKYKCLLDDKRTPVGVVSYVALVIAFATRLLPQDLLSYVLPLCTPLSGFAKVTYVYGIVRARNADAVSLATWVISVSTNVVPTFAKMTYVWFQPLCTPLSEFAKVTYVYGIVRARNADAVSLATWVISVSTNVARLFTVYVDSADKTLMFNFAVSTVLSLSVLLTALYYQRLAPGAPPSGSPRSRRRSKQSRERERSRSRAMQHEHDD
ncbi:PQ loop repeat domain-containing protein [Phthorimaea operculella]|nr:PQ loop repeat domain-containing protein [Phthorimaea operculella]